MAEVKLQYSVISENCDKHIFRNIIHGFTPGVAPLFYVINKWIWDRGEQNPSESSSFTDGFYQITEIKKDTRVIARAESDIFSVKLSHTHYNRFKQIGFDPGGEYRIRVRLYDKKGIMVNGGSIEYPIFVEPPGKE